MKKCKVWLAVGALIPIGSIVFLAMLDNACTLSSSLGEGESVNQCYTRWIGALSGWFAGGAAVATLAVIWRTLVTAQESNRILEKQTKSVTGELDPVFNHNGQSVSERTKELFRFWNYNRRAITVDSLEILEPPNVIFAAVAYKRPNQSGIYIPVWEESELSAQKIKKIIAVKGTPTGKSCEPLSFSLSFYLDDPYSVDKRVAVTLRMRWRYRDAHNTERRETDCTSIVTAYSLGTSLPP